MDKSKKKIEYSSLDQRSHVLHRPDMYIGSIKPIKQDCYIADKDTYQIIKKEINYNPGLDRIFIEALSNAIDNVWRSEEFDEKCTKIKITINPETGETSVWNDGLSIPTEKNEKTGLYNVEMIFGNLLTSSNYNDKEERKTSGRNGLGIKLSSIFSKSFCVKTVDPKTEKMYEQTWSDNMSKRSEPKIKASKLKHGYTEVSWTPDFQKFGCEGYSEDMLAVYYKHVIDCAMITKVNVYLNDVKIPVKNLQEYAKLYLNQEKQEEDDDEEKRKKCDNILFITHEGCEVVLTPNESNNFDAISFVNGVETYEGGVHVEAWSNAIFKPILEKINGAGKKGTPQLNLKDVKQFFRLFLNCSLINPEFTSQEKTKLSAPNVKTKIETKHINNIMKWDVIEKIKDIIRSKELLALKKTEKKKGFKKIEGYDPANNAGGKWSQDCTLILCEGLSAKTYAVMGIEVGAYGKKGRDWYGIYPLRGKVLNTRNASTTSISKNREITDIIQALGLKFGVDYTDDKNFNTLNYGKLMLLTDQDDDGIHISGLIINMFHSLFPSLIKRENSFLITMKTPLIRIYQKNKDICFYSVNEYKKYIEEKGKVEGRVKYFKGLGTSNEKEVKDSFGKKIVEYIEDDKTDENINKVFHTKFSDVRKTWLESYDPNNVVLENEDENVNKMTYSDFMDHEMIKFSIDDCKRSIPNLIDGLKESHRKILYSCFLKNLKHSGKTLKVAQLAGFVAEKTNYHHGEQCLYDTITKMAHEFPGSNNIPLLFRDGQFGCLSPETPVLLWNGSIKRADEIQINDILIGDDGKQRKVLNITSGEDEMYEVKTTTNQTYIVNSQHILTLYFHDNNIIKWKESDASYRLKYFNGKTIKESTIRTKDNNQGITNDHYNKSKITKEEAYERIIQKQKEIQDKYKSAEFIDIKLEDYLNLSKHNKKELYMISNTTSIQWKKQSVPVDPYVLGIWLGDGNQDGCGITSIDEEIIKSFALYADSINCELVHTISNGIHDNYHYSIRKKNSGKRTSIGDNNHSVETCEGCIKSVKKSPVCDWKFEKSESSIIYSETVDGSVRSDMNNWKNILKSNNLYKNKHIPNCYLINDRDTRLKLLAGFVDTDGTIRKSQSNKGLQQHIEISQSKRLHYNLILQLDFLSKSLGFNTTIKEAPRGFTKKGEEIVIITLSIYGEKLYEIPTKLDRKKLNNNTESRFKKYYNYNKFEIKSLGKGKFNGWSVDDNERFLLGNFIVTHNSRVAGGKDAASARYIFTKLEALTRLIFREEDDILLERIQDDGELVEPRYFVPILPMVLVNGITGGIGTGWSCSIPNFNPVDIIKAIKIWLEENTLFEDEEKSISKMDEILPWYRGFTGKVEKISPNKFATYGHVTEEKQGVHIVDELPIGLWTEKFKENVETLLEEKEIKSYKNYSTSDKIHFVINENNNGISCNLDTLKLKTTFTTTNMVLFSENDTIKKYDTIDEIIDSFCKVRFDYYIKRKKHILNDLREVLKYANNKYRFLSEVMDDKLKVHKRDEKDLIKDLESRGYDKKLTKKEEKEEDDEEEKDEKGSYRYLLDLKIRSFTKQKLEELKKEIDGFNQRIKDTEKTSEKQMWINDLNDFEIGYQKWLDEMNKKESKKETKGKRKVKKNEDDK